MSCSFIFYWSYSCNTLCYKKPKDAASHIYHLYWLPWWFSGKQSTCQCRRWGFDPWVGKIPLEKEMATQSSILSSKNPTDTGAWQATVHGVAKSQTWLSSQTTTTNCTITSITLFNVALKMKEEAGIGHSNQNRKRNKRNPNWKRRSKTLTVCRWHDPLHRKP